jgi:hypothetical protein
MEKASNDHDLPTKGTFREPDRKCPIHVWNRIMRRRFMCGYQQNSFTEKILLHMIPVDTNDLDGLAPATYVCRKYFLNSLHVVSFVCAERHCWARIQFSTQKNFM